MVFSVSPLPHPTAISVSDNASHVSHYFESLSDFMTGGPRNILPGAIMFALFGAGGQALYNSADARNLAQVDAPEKDLKQSWLNSKWSPMKVLSDKEYEEMLREKLLRVNAEIALVDENIEALRVQNQEIESGREDGIQRPLTK